MFPVRSEEFGVHHLSSSHYRLHVETDDFGKSSKYIQVMNIMNSNVKLLYVHLYRREISSQAVRIYDSADAELFAPKECVFVLCTQISVSNLNSSLGGSYNRVEYLLPLKVF